MSEKTTPLPEKATPSGTHTAGAFDIRNIIGALLGIYGVILLLAGLFGDTASAKTGGINANLWTGLALAVASAVFLVWARLKPIVVPAHVEPVEDDPTRPAPRRRPADH
ncbi:hypothetical protein [Nostocoides sp. HKS02]|uniref:hypothetical protein n=1 Tax=Nostocoides sp. HKS02 TaxID=1813880 RepID=UPI0012B4C9DA|nr:hypothetical protein [Tetrasphaera sp. HKS02]QGN58412.1 hypothetical protein GKE56_11545 [Tetrasphaera sp. HKS02]